MTIHEILTLANFIMLAIIVVLMLSNVIVRSQWGWRREEGGAQRNPMGR
jgi:hypothetical protein